MTHDTTHLSSAGLERRTLVAGAAWTIPVIATAVGAPLAAASTGATLTFTNGPYSVAACGTLKDVVLRVTTNGTAPAPAGTLVTVTLPAGLTWSDSSTGAKVLPTDANGEIVLSGVTADGASASTVIGASTTDASTSAPVSIAPSDTAHQYNLVGASDLTVPNVPGGSTPIGGGFYRSPTGDVYLNNGAIVATGSAAGAVGGYDPEGGSYLQYTKNGAAFQYNAVGSATTPWTLPTGATPVGGGFWLTADGDVYFEDRLIRSGVAEAVGNWTAATSGFVGITDRSGATGQYNKVGGYFAVPAPTGSRPVGGGFYLAPNGDIYTNTGVLAATGTSSAIGDYTVTSGGFVGFIKEGIAFQYNTVGSQTFAPAIPSGTVPVGGGFYLAPNGDLYSNTGVLVRTDVIEARGQYTTASGGFVGYTRASC